MKNHNNFWNEWKIQNARRINEYEIEHQLLECTRIANERDTGMFLHSNSLKFPINLENVVSLS